MSNRRHILCRIVVVLLANAVVLLVPRDVPAQSLLPSCPLIIGGGGMAMQDYEVVYSAKRDGTGSRIHGMVIVRASRQFRNQNPPRAMLERFRIGKVRHHGGGGSVGPLSFTIDSAAGAVWLNDSLAIPLKSNNNVLLVDVDSSGTPKVAGQAQINSRFPAAAGGCSKDGWANPEEARDTLMARFQASPTIRDFVRR